MNQIGQKTFTNNKTKLILKQNINQVKDGCGNKRLDLRYRFFFNIPFVTYLSLLSKKLSKPIHNINISNQVSSQKSFHSDDNNLDIILSIINRFTKKKNISIHNNQIPLPFIIHRIKCIYAHKRPHNWISCCVFKWPLFIFIIY